MKTLPKIAYSLAKNIAAKKKYNPILSSINISNGYVEARDYGIAMRFEVPDLIDENLTIEAAYIQDADMCLWERSSVQVLDEKVDTIQLITWSEHFENTVTAVLVPDWQFRDTSAFYEIDPNISCNVDVDSMIRILKTIKKTGISRTKISLNSFCSLPRILFENCDAFDEPKYQAILIPLK